MKNNTNGFAFVVIVLLVVIMILAVGGLYYVDSKKSNNEGEQSRLVDTQSEVKVSTTSVQSVVKNENAGWETYRNDDLGFEMKYPTVYSVLPIVLPEFEVMPSEEQPIAAIGKKDRLKIEITVNRAGIGGFSTRKIKKEGELFYEGVGGSWEKQWGMTLDGNPIFIYKNCTIEAECGQSYDVLNSTGRPVAFFYAHWTNGAFEAGEVDSFLDNIDKIVPTFRFTK